MFIKILLVLFLLSTCRSAPAAKNLMPDNFVDTHLLYVVSECNAISCHYTVYEFNQINERELQAKSYEWSGLFFMELPSVPKSGDVFYSCEGSIVSVEEFQRIWDFISDLYYTSQKLPSSRYIKASRSIDDKRREEILLTPTNGTMGCVSRSKTNHPIQEKEIEGLLQSIMKTTFACKESDYEQILQRLLESQEHFVQRAAVEGIVKLRHVVPEELFQHSSWYVRGLVIEISSKLYLHELNLDSIVKVKIITILTNLAKNDIYQQEDGAYPVRAIAEKRIREINQHNAKIAMELSKSTQEICDEFYTEMNQIAQEPSMLNYEVEYFLDHYYESLVIENRKNKVSYSRILQLLGRDLDKIRCISESDPYQAEDGSYPLREKAEEILEKLRAMEAEEAAKASEQKPAEKPDAKKKSSCEKAAP